MDSGTCGAEGDGSNLTWTLDSEGLLTIGGTGAMKDYSDVYYNCAPWKYREIKKVVIDNGVTSIGSYAFYDCDYLASVIIPNSVTCIGNGTFYDCTSLASVTIPNSVTSIGDDAFRACRSLASITIPDSVTSIEQ